MRLTTKGRYAVTAMLDLALHRNEGPVSLADISQRQTISLSYLEQLFSMLRKSSLVSSVRGPGGGYKLERQPESVGIAEIIDAVSESVDATKCRGSGDCQDGEICLTHHLWEELSEQIHTFLEGITLYDLIEKREIKHIAETQDRKQLLMADMSGRLDKELRVPVTSL